MPVLIPASTVSAGPWTAVGRGAGLADCLEAVADADDDLTYMIAATGGTGILRLASGSDGTDARHTVTFRARASGGPSVAAPRLLVELYETSTWRGSLEVDIPFARPYEWQTSSFQVYGIEVWSDLRLHFTPTRILGAGQKLRVTAAQLEYVSTAVTASFRGRVTGPGVKVGRLATAGVKRGTLPHC